MPCLCLFFGHGCLHGVGGLNLSRMLLFLTCSISSMTHTHFSKGRPTTGSYLLALDRNFINPSAMEQRFKKILASQCKWCDYITCRIIAQHEIVFS